MSRNKHCRRCATRPAGEQQFVCTHCDLSVSCDPGIAGVQNRNHCPYCLWSRHLDWREPGDRMASCRAAMEPIALSTKRSRNKYAGERDGELMLIHRCAGCGKLVLNRIAADDSADAILAVFASAQGLGQALGAELRLQGVAILTAADGDLVRRRLYGSGVAASGEGRARRAS